MNRQSGKDIWKEKLLVNYIESAEVNGNYKNGTNTININKKYLGNDKETAAKRASVATHEASHYAGVNTEKGAHLQGLDGYVTALSIYGIQSDNDFLKSIVYEIKNLNNLKENTGEVQEQRVLKNGDIYDNKRDGEISFEDGRETFYTNSKFKQGSLEEYLITENRALNGLLDNAGFDHEEGKGWIEFGKTIKAEDIQKLIDAGIIKKSDYAVNNKIDFVNGVKDLFSSIGNAILNFVAGIKEKVIRAVNDITGKGGFARTETGALNQKPVAETSR